MLDQPIILPDPGAGQATTRVAAMSGLSRTGLAGLTLRNRHKNLDIRTTDQQGCRRPAVQLTNELIELLNRTDILGITLRGDGENDITRAKVDTTARTDIHHQNAGIQTHLLLLLSTEVRNSNP